MTPHSTVRAGKTSWLIGFVAGSVAGASWLTWCAGGEVVVSGLMMGRLVQEQP